MKLTCNYCGLDEPACRCEDLVSLADPLPDLTHEPDAAAGYEEWMREREADEEVADLREWARQTLLCAPLPCVCQNRTCLRCRVAGIVSPPEAA